jgi:hypothetical protein
MTIVVWNRKSCCERIVKELAVMNNGKLVFWAPGTSELSIQNLEEIGSIARVVTLSNSMKSPV